MRQAGILAAAAIYALEHNVARLADDHSNATRLAQGLNDVRKLSVDLGAVQTNIVYVDLAPSLGTAAEFTERLERAGVRTLPTAPQRFRAVTHLDVSTDDIERAIEVVANLGRP